jgi:hypothetical protein
MKKATLLLAFVLAFITTLRAQNINVNNNVWGDVYVTVYAYQAGSCTTFIDNSVTTLVSAYSSATINLGIASNWSLSTVPSGPYDIVYATVSRDPACPGSSGWGAINGTCWLGGNDYLDESTVGDPACGYNTHACLSITYTGSGTCSGFNAGEVAQVDFGPGGSNANIDVNW